MPTRHPLGTAPPAVVGFCEGAVDFDLPELTKLATRIDTWAGLGAGPFNTRATSAVTEAANVKIKSIRRAARGFRIDGIYRPHPAPRRPPA